jgi:hypothetical protein
MPAVEERRTLALQLKGYLLLFEQLLADHLAQLDNASSLLSIAAIDEPDTIAAIGPTYFTQPLLHTPPLPEDPPDAAKVFRPGRFGVRADRARDEGRRERALDHMLARFGEAFDDAAIAVTQKTTDDVHATTRARLARKRKFLEDVVTLSRARGSGIDYRFGTLAYVPAADGMLLLLPMQTAIERRIALLADVDGALNGPVYSRLYVVEHVVLRPRSDPTHDSDDDDFALSLVYRTPVQAPDWQQLIERIARENCPAHLDLRYVPLNDDSDVARFEVLYSTWATAWQPSAAVVDTRWPPKPFLDESAPVDVPDNAALAGVDVAAGELRDFLSSRRAKV